MKARILEVSQVEAIRAAGGVVCRPGPAGLLEVAVIHRPAYDDWTLPKGKLEPGESAVEAALREVEEETGFVCELLDEVGCVRYLDRKGRDKTVCYWRMGVVEGRFRSGLEVDELRWLTVEEAAEVLTYAHDRSLLDRLD